MLGPWLGVHLFCLLVAGIRIFIKEISVHKKILSVNYQGTNQRSGLFLFPSVSSCLTKLLFKVFSKILIFLFGFSKVCGLKWSYDNRELASGGNDNRVCKC